MMHNPFTPTGALAQDDPLFQGRAAELSQLERACLNDHKSFLLVYGGRQNGKTSLLLRLESRLRERLPERVRVCRVDFQGIPRVTTDAAFQHLIAELRPNLPHLPPVPATAGIPELRGFLEQALAGDEVQRLVLLLDELARLPEATREDLAHVIRALHTHRLVSPALAKTQFVLAGGLELYDLAIVQASTLRNVCEIVRLNDLGEADAVALIATGLTLVGVATEPATTLGRAVYARVSGHPYLTQRIGGLLAERHLRGDPLDEALVEELCWALLDGEDSLLEHLRRSIGDPQLAGAARRLLTANQRTSTTDDDTARLELLGLARRNGRYWVPRSPLLAVALAEWLHFGMPSTDRMADAAQATRQAALTRYLSDLKLEHATTASHAERAITPAEQMRLQRHANELADEISRIEAAQPVETPAPATTDAVITAKKRRLAALELTAARYGIDCPPHITIEIEDLRREIGQFERRAAPAPASPVTPKATQPPPTPAASVKASPPSPAHGSGGQGVRVSWLPTLIPIPAGPFLMGSSDTDTQADSDEKPPHTLTLPDFWIGKTPVTNAQFRPFVEGDGYRNRQYWTQAGWQWREQEKIVTPRYWDNEKWNGADYPLVGVSWFEAVAYCRWLSAQTSHEFRLPNEAEWEKAARGTDGRIWPWGNTWEVGRCNSKEAGIGKTTPVGQYPNGASPYGVLDMAGNVWEWCATKWGKPYPYQIEDEWQDAYLEQDVSRIWRGGSWYFDQKLVRGAFRLGTVNARYRSDDMGLRVASRSPLPGSVS